MMNCSINISVEKLKVLPIRYERARRIPSKNALASTDNLDNDWAIMGRR